MGVSSCSKLSFSVFFVFEEKNVNDKLTNPPPPGLYGTSIHVWDWTSHEKLQSLDLGAEGAVPLEVRFLHEPSAAQGYVGCALGSTVYRFFRTKVGRGRVDPGLGRPPGPGRPPGGPRGAQRSSGHPWDPPVGWGLGDPG